jgi:hypothetical protein
MLTVSANVTCIVEDRAEAIEFMRELQDFYDDKPPVTINSVVTDDLEPRE